MNKFLTLTRVLLKNGSSPYNNAGKKKKNVSLIVVVLCFIPLIFSTTAMFYAIYGPLAKVGLEGLVLAGLEAVTGVTMVVFGILYTISVYYFSDDAVVLLTMPLKSEQILAAKFVVVNIYQYLMEAIILLPCVLAYATHIHTVPFIVYSVITLIVMPVIPSVVCSVISIVLMVFGRFFRNKDRVKTITGLLGIVMALGINFGIQALAGNASGGTEALAGKKDLIDKATLVFPSAKLSASALLQSGSLAGLGFLLAFLAVSAAAVALFLLLGRGLYLTGVINLTQVSSSGRRGVDKQLRAMATRRPLVLAFAQREWKLLYRTPGFFLNCIIGGLVFPPLMVFIYGFTSVGVRIPSNGFVLAFGVVILCFLCIFNLCSPTAVSREGKYIYVARYIPVPFRTMVLGKLLPGLLMSGFSVILVCVIAGFTLQISPLTLVLLAIAALVLISAVNMLGLLFDLISPKLDWDDEMAAVKRNYNFLIELLAILVIMAILVGCAFLEAMLGLGLIAMFITALLVGAGLCAAIYPILVTKGAQLLSGYRADIYRLQREAARPAR